MKILVTPCNNTLSHIAKGLALRQQLEARGHEVHLAVSAMRASFLESIDERRYVILPDIQEASGAPLPCFSWFRPERFEACVRAEVDLLNRLRPDVVLGVFRFTGPLSAALAGIPYDSLICGCMTPACPDVLGFEPGEPGEEEQSKALRFFRRTCAQRLHPVFSSFGLPPVDDAWQLLVGQRTYLWDYPEFQPLPATPGFHHVGPVLWTKWPTPKLRGNELDTLKGPVAYVAFGTGDVPPEWLTHLVRALWNIGYSVAIALGGRPVLVDLPPDPLRLSVFDFLPVEVALPRASLVVCHGGQGLIFEALSARVPVFVLPMQPEQAQNGRCLERMGCGTRLLRGNVFGGRASHNLDAFLERPIDILADEMAAFLASDGLHRRLEEAARTQSGYRGAEQLATVLENR